MSWAASKAVGLWVRRRAMRALSVGSELSGIIRGILLADVCADLLQLEPDGRYWVTASPEMLAREVSLFTGQAGDCDSTLHFRNPITDATGRFGGIAMH